MTDYRMTVQLHAALEGLGASERRGLRRLAAATDPKTPLGRVLAGVAVELLRFDLPEDELFHGLAAEMSLERLERDRADLPAHEGGGAALYDPETGVTRIVPEAGGGAVDDGA